MTHRATALIKFKHCNFGEHFAEAEAVYDNAPQTAWIALFRIAQKDYWARQPSIAAPKWLPLSFMNQGHTIESLSGRAFNPYADDLAAKRNTAIYDSAKSAFDDCMAGGAATPTAQAVEPCFRLAVRTKLEDGAVLGDASSNAGLAAQINVPFAPANPANAISPLDWRPFYRLGAISWAICAPHLWNIEPLGGVLASRKVHLTTTHASSAVVQISLPWFTSISAGIEQYIPVPEGYVLSAMGNLNADFSSLASSFDFTITRHVYLPDGTHLRHTVNYSYGVTLGGIDSKKMYPSFDPFTASCAASGWVEVYYVIELYTVATIYELNNDIEKMVDANGVAHPRRVLVGIEGFSGSSGYPPTGFNSAMESFYFVHFDLGAVVITVGSTVGGVYLFHRGNPPVIPPELELSFYLGYFTFYYPDNVYTVIPESTYGPDVQSFPLVIHLGQSSILYDIPIIERVSVAYTAPDEENGIPGGYILQSAPTAHVFNSPISNPLWLDVMGHDLVLRINNTGGIGSNGSPVPNAAPMADFRIL
jgi:hypothetical protein